MKRILLIALVMFGVAGFAAAIQQVANGPERATAPSTVEAPGDSAISSPSGDTIIVTYFSSDIRCASCVRLEDWSRKAVENNFAQEIRDGKVVFRVINLNGEGNLAYARHYELVSKTVIVSEIANGKEIRWENLQQVWTKLRDPEGFETYIAESVRRHLGARS